MRIVAFFLTLAAAAAGPSPFMDYRQERPGREHLIRPADMPAPDQAEDVRNAPEIVSRPRSDWPQAPAGFRVELFADGFRMPRLLRLAPNGDVFLAESAAGRIRVLRGVTARGKAQKIAVFASGLRRPFGIAFYPPGSDPRYIYVADTDAVLRFPYKSGDLKAAGKPERLFKLPTGGHWTRDLAFSADGKTLYVSVGSHSNLADTDTDSDERGRADILAFDPDGKNERVYASGLRNAAGIAVDPATGALWASVNERDRLGDNLPPDYVTRVQKGGFYGWPWYYIGGHPDPRLPDKHPELKEKTIVPDVLLQPHIAPLQLAFYTGTQFPARYRGGLFVASHGSWNRSRRAGYEILFVPLENGGARGAYEDFVTGFVAPDGRVWGRPVGVAEASDGALLFSDDASGSVWRVSYGVQGS